MIDVNWGEANEAILIWTFYDSWTTQDFVAAFTISENFVANIAQHSTVHILIDMQHTAHMPRDMSTLDRYAIKGCINLRKKGLIVIINPTSVWLQIYNIINRMVSNSLNICFAKDADEAYQIIAEADALLASKKNKFIC